MEKLMIINWRWKGFDEEKKFNSKSVGDGKKKYIISVFKKNEIEKFNKFIQAQMDNYNPKYLLVLTHFNSENTSTDIQIDKSRITIQSSANTTIKIRNIRGGNVSEQYKYIYDSEEGMIDTEGDNYNNQLKIENFDKVWKFYWDDIELEYQKKTLINLWLPLAIDIQGLSELQNETKKAKKYFNKIKKETEYLESLTSFSEEEDFPRWKEIKDELYKDDKTKAYAEFNPTSIAKELKKKETTFDSFKNNDSQYLENDVGNNPNPTFLPNWLKSILTKLDGNPPGTQSNQ